MLTVPGYHIIAELHRSIHTVIYRGQQRQPSRPVILKTLADGHSPDSVARLQHEYAILKSLDLEGVIKAYGLEIQRRLPVLVLEDVGGVSLRDYVSAHPLTLKQFLDIAVQLVETLGKLHQRNIIHQDIKPSNIVLNPSNQRVKLVDFAIATRHDVNKPSLSTSDVMEGTLAYMSPEQTGRMNRAVDYRSDFYSLGVTLYELLCRQLPFDATDPMEIVHCHIARQPIPPHHINPDIPEPIANIVMKLLAKMADDRYQSAWGIEADLVLCLMQYEATGIIEDLVPGENDISDRLQIPQQLYGRATQFQELVTIFAQISGAEQVPDVRCQVSGNNPQDHPHTLHPTPHTPHPTPHAPYPPITALVLVSGYAGCGKSSLVKELHVPVLQQQGYFSYGTFTEADQAIPYSGVIAALRSLIRQLLSESDNRLQVWRTQLLAALGTDTARVIQMVPELAMVLDQPVPSSTCAIALDDNGHILQRMLQVFCQPEHPLVLFLDDLQWADLQTLGLLESLVANASLHHLLLVGAYRSNEIGTGHPLLATLVNVHGTGFVHHIPLEPLSLEDITHLLADTLRQSHAIVQPLAAVVMRKTAGNPHFIHEFLHTLYRQALIQFDFERLHWTWDLKPIEALQTTENLIDLAINKLTKLPEPTRLILQSAACLGTWFDLSTLEELQQRPLVEIYQDLHPAVQEGLVMSTSEQEFDQNTTVATTLYRFLHERVQKAAYSLIPLDQRAALHWCVGRILLAMTPPSTLEDNLFDIVNHLNLGAELISDPQERMELVHLNLLTGRKASSANAYGAATAYFNNGLKLLPASCWQTDYDTALSFHNEAATANFLATNLQLAIDLSDVVFQNATALLDQVTACEITLRCFAARSQFQDALTLALAILNQLGLFLDSDSSPTLTALEAQAALRILRQVLPLARSLNPPLFQQMLSLMQALSMQSGQAAQSDLWDKQLLPTIARWHQPFRHSCATLHTAIQASLDSGNPEVAARCAVDYCYYLLWSGESLVTIAQEQQHYREMLHKLKQTFSEDCLAPWQQLVQNLASTPDKLQPLVGTWFNELAALPKFQAEGNLTLLCLTYSAKAYLSYLMGNDVQAIADITQAIQCMAGLPDDHLPMHQTLHGLILLAGFSQADLQQQKATLMQVKTLQAMLQDLSNHAPDNVQGLSDLVQAELARAQADPLQAMEFYDRAIHQGVRMNMPHHEAIAAERASRFYAGLGRQDIALLYLRRAHDSYSRWGATAKVQHLETLHPRLLESVLPSSETHSMTLTASSSSSTHLLDFTTVLKASQVLASEIILDRLLEKLMQIAIENAGAEWGSLLLEQDGTWAVAASGDSNQVTVLPKPSGDALNTQSPTLPDAIINYVLRTRTDVVLDDPAQMGQFITDPYIRMNQPKSVLCAPLIHQTKLSGILYLENNLTIGAFTPDRLEVLQLLSSQIAISIENAQLYANLNQFNQNLEHLVEKRTQELSQTLSNLRTTQSKLVESEKMAALGGLVAGVAHEINTPIGIGVTAASLLADRTTTFLETYRNGKMKRSDLEAFLDTAHQSSAMILANLTRAAELIQGFKQVAIDQSSEERRCFDLRTYLDEILLSLRPKLKVTKHTVTIAGDDRILLDSHPGAFSQIITNLVMNSLLHAYDPQDRGQITIALHTDEEQLQMTYADDGKGIAPENLPKIFDPFFTTRRGQGGSGLGLHIVYNLVTQKLHGTIHCQSQPGEGTTFVITVPLQVPA